VLTENAVNYAVQGQDASGLTIGEWRQTRPSMVIGDLVALIVDGGRVWVCEDDLVERGIAVADLMAGVEPIARSGLARLFADYDQVWRW
jgi:sulfur relay (sulfurtransferase) DsrF/TusC family protein